MKSSNYIIAGIGTDVGKTVASTILVKQLEADYWKPIECGPESDSASIRGCKIHPPAYSFKAPLSPHHAALLENRFIDLNSIVPPKTDRPLVIEMAGGIFTPLTLHQTNFDLFSSWEAQWILVVRHYLGSLNHTLLTCRALQGLPCKILWNGPAYPEGEAAILKITGLPVYGRIPHLQEL